MYKNIEKAKILSLPLEIEANPGQVVSKTLVQNDKVSITLFAFGKGEEIGMHKSSGDAMVTIIEGTGQLTVGEDVFTLQAGQTLIMPADIDHAVYAVEDFKMILIISF